MARLKITQPCGCILALDYNDMIKVIYCPKHCAAPEMYEALKEISEGKGRFSRDPLTHAENCIEDMKNLALKALAKAEGK